MATGDKQVNITLDRLLSQTALKEQLLGYLSSKLDEVLASIMQGTSGTLDSAKIGLAADGTDKIKLDLSQADKVVIGGSGQVITLPADIVDATKEVDFENDTGVTYYVGVGYAQIPTDPDVNPRKGTAEYLSLEDSFGETAKPDASPAPADTPGVKLRLYINDITETAVDNSGRVVRVWLAEPVSSVESVAFFEGESGFDGSNNYIDIPYSGADGPCGQDTSANPPSTDPNDYRVFIKGISIKKVNIENSPDFAFIGTITGNGPSATPAAFDDSNQKAVFFNTLDKGYDGIGSGGGRVVTLDSGPIEARIPTTGPGGADDPWNAGILVDASDDATSTHTLPLVAIAKPGDEGGGLLVGKVMTDPNGPDNILVNNICTIFSSTQVQNSGLQDWVGGGVQKGDYAWLHGFATANGLFEVINQSTLHLSLMALDGTTPSLNIGETGQVTIIRPMLSVNDASFGGGSSRNRSIVARGHNQAGAGAPLFALHGHQQDAIAVLNDDGTATYFRVQQDGRVVIPLLTGDTTAEGKLTLSKTGDVGLEVSGYGVFSDELRVTGKANFAHGTVSADSVQFDATGKLKLMNGSSGDDGLTISPDGQLDAGELDQAQAYTTIEKDGTFRLARSNTYPGGLFQCDPSEYFGTPTALGFRFNKGDGKGFSWVSHASASNGAWDLTGWMYAPTYSSAVLCGAAPHSAGFFKGGREQWVDFQRYGTTLANAANPNTYDDIGYSNGGSGWYNQTAWANDYMQIACGSGTYGYFAGGGDYDMDPTGKALVMRVRFMVSGTSNRRWFIGVLGHTSNLPSIGNSYDKVGLYYDSIDHGNFQFMYKKTSSTWYHQDTGVAVVPWEPYYFYLVRTDDVAMSVQSIYGGQSSWPWHLGTITFTGFGAGGQRGRFMAAVEHYTGTGSIYLQQYYVASSDCY